MSAKIAKKSCSQYDVETILDVDTSECGVNDSRKVWILPKDSEKRNPSNNIVSVLQKYWKRNSECTTRSYIDMICLDVLKSDLPTGKAQLSCFGNVKLQFTNNNNGLTFSGLADYAWGYGNEIGSETIIIEAKKVGEQLDLWQLVAYVGILQKNRQLKKKIISTCYGIVTDSILWIFVKIDESGKCWSSTIKDITNNRTEIWTWVNYILQNASPASTPSALVHNITKENFHVIVERFQTADSDEDEEGDEDEFDIEAATERFDSALRIGNA